MFRSLRLLALAASVALALLGGGAAPASAQPVRGWHYEITPSADLSTIRVRICFRGYVPRRLVLAPLAATTTVRPLEPRPGDRRLVLAADGRSFTAPGLSDGDCVAYEVDVGRVMDEAGHRRWVARQGEDLLLWPGLWLMRPYLWPQGGAVTATLRLPEGLDASVPWPRGPGGLYHLDAGAVDLEGYVAFGSFRTIEVEANGARFELALLDGAIRASDDGLRRWISEAARAVSLLHGRFPMRRVQILVRPTGGRGSPVTFGRTTRGGGGGVSLYLSSQARDEDLPGEWVAIHEFLHLGMPVMKDVGAWLSEGFVTYYQEVLRARAGFQTELDGWQELHEGFARGRRTSTDRGLVEDSRMMHRTHAYWRVYWSGCAIALLCDLELRRRSGGTRSLDDVMRMWRDRLQRSPRLWDGVELMTVADEWLGAPVMRDIAAPYLDSSTFPDVSPAYEALGLDGAGRRVRPLDAGTQREARSAIMDGAP